MSRSIIVDQSKTEWGDESLEQIRSFFNDPALEQKLGFRPDQLKTARIICELLESTDLGEGRIWNVCPRTRWCYSTAKYSSTSQNKVWRPCPISRLARFLDEDPSIFTEFTNTPAVIRRMTNDVLMRARAEVRAFKTTYYRIGNTKLREPDYRQILYWARALSMTPKSVLKHLLAASVKTSGESKFKIEDGAIVSLVWDFHRFPCTPEPWRKGLLIRELQLDNHYLCYSKWPWERYALRPDLPLLETLSYSCINIKSLDLFLVPKLIKLNCRGYSSPSSYTVVGLAKLDLSPVPNLTWLNCSENELTELDLSPVPNLTWLGCFENELTELDLSPVPNLTGLHCAFNKLNELDLSPVPNLTELNCSLNNSLTELDLSPVPKLTDLNCRENELTELDLSPVPNLTGLHCDSNKLTELDLSPVPNLTDLDCSDNELSELDLSPVPKLTELDCSDNELSELDLSLVPNLTALNCSNNQLTELDLAPTPNLKLLAHDESIRVFNVPANVKIVSAFDWPIFHMIKRRHNNAPD